MSKEEGRYAKRGVELVHPSNRVFFRYILGEMQKARHSKNPRIMSTLCMVLASLKRYPIPIERSQDASVLAGVGELMVTSFDMARIWGRRYNKWQTEPPSVHAERVLSRLRIFLANNGFDHDEDVESAAWKPVKFSSAWTFLMILGLFSDEDGNDKLSFDDIMDKKLLLQRQLPKCKLNDVAFIRQLVNRGIVDFHFPEELRGKSKKDPAVFKRSRATLYRYYLTEKGRRMTESLISSCEIPISLKNGSLTIFTQVSISPQDAEEPAEIFTSNDSYTSCNEQSIDSDDDMQYILGARIIDELSYVVGEVPSPDKIESQKQELLMDQPSTSIRSADISCLASYRYTSSLDNEEGSNETVPDSQKFLTSEPIIISELVSDEEEKNTIVTEMEPLGVKEEDPIVVAADASESSIEKRESLSLTTADAIDERNSPNKVLSSRRVSSSLFEDMVTSIALDTSLDEITVASPVHEEQMSEGFRTPPTGNSGTQFTDCAVGSGWSDNMGESADVGSHSQGNGMNLDSMIYKEGGLLSEVTSTRYRDTAEVYEETPQCYSQFGIEADGLTLERKITVDQAEAEICLQGSNDDLDDVFVRYKASANKSSDDITVASGMEEIAKSHPSQISEAEPINIDCDSNSSQEGAVTPLVSMPTSLLESSHHGQKSTSACDRFLPLTERLKQRYKRTIGAADAGRFDVITVVDNRELNDADGRYLRRITEVFAQAGKPVFFRQLPLGDVIWLLTYIPPNGDVNPLSQFSATPTRSDIGTNNGDTTYTNGEQDEADATPNMAQLKRLNASRQKKESLGDCFVLDWVLERKTTVDLMASITDGRYEDQKIRMLRLVGFRHVCYIFEDIEAGTTVGRVSSINKGVNAAAINSARMHTQLVTGFNVMRTTGMSHTASSILIMHKHIERCVKDRLSDAASMGKDLMNAWLKRNYMAYNEWEARNRRQKQMSFLELFGKQLRSIPGCGAETTQAILENWPKPSLLSQELGSSNLAYINDVLSQHRSKGKRALVSNNLYANLKELYVKDRRKRKAASQHK